MSSQSGEAFGYIFAAGAADLRYVLACQGVLILDFDLVDLVSPNILLLDCIHQIDFD